MKYIPFYSFFVFYLALIVFASEFEESSESSEIGDVINGFSVETPATIKQEFIFALTNGDTDTVKNYIEKYDYLTKVFNVDIFIGLLNCFNIQSNEAKCMKCFELLKPSFRDVSISRSTPLIHAIIYQQMNVVHNLLNDPEIENIIDNVDYFGRTALMYAAKIGSFYAVKRILLISKKSVNIKDRFGKTALHYTCEMKPVHGKNTIDIKFPSFLTGTPDLDSQLMSKIFGMILFSDCEIFSDGPEYTFSSKSCVDMMNVIDKKGGKFKLNEKPEQLLVVLIKNVLISQFITFLGFSDQANQLKSFSIKYFFANQFMLILNELCSKVQKFIYPEMDMKFDIELNNGQEVEHFSFNILFVFLIIAGLSSIMQKRRI